MAADVSFLFGQFVPRCQHRIAKRFDGYNVLQLCDGGGVDLTVEDHNYRLEGRWFWSSYPGPHIRFNVAPPHKSWVHRYLAFRGPRVKRWIAQGLFPIAPQLVDVRSDYPQRFDLLLDLSRRTDRWGVIRATLLLETILTELAEARAQPRALPDWLDPVLAQIQQFDIRVDQDRLAALAEMPPRTFRRHFAEAMGMSPMDYVIHCRVTHAKELLGGTEIPIKQVAEQLGYKDVFFFTRQFRKTTGVTPAAYRRSRED